eukprot:1352547-Pyramimonas_sp.AAC.1
MQGWIAPERPSLFALAVRRRRGLAVGDLLGAGDRGEVRSGLEGLMGGRPEQHLRPPAPPPLLGLLLASSVSSS